MTLARLAVRSTMWLSGGQYAGSAVALASNLLLARMLGAAPFGLFLVVSSTVDTVFLFAAAFAFGQYLIQAPVVTAHHCRVALTLTAAVSLAGIAVAGVLAWALSGRYSHDVVTLLLALAVVRGLWQVTLVATCLLERALAYRALVLCRIAGALGSGVAAVAVAYAGAGVWSLFARELGMAVVGTVATLLAVRRFVSFDPAQDMPVVADVWRFGVRISGVQMLEQAFHRIDGLLLGALLGAGHVLELGWYAQAKYIANVPNVAADPGARAVAYRIYAIVQGEPERLRDMVGATQFWTIRLVLPIALVFFAVPGGLCRSLLGPTWAAAAPVLRALAFFGPLLVLFNNLKMLRLVLHDWSGLYRAYVIQLVVLVASMAIGVSLFGVVGGAASLTLALGAGYIAIARGSCAAKRAPIDARVFAVPCAAALAVAVLAFMQPALWNGNTVAGIASVLIGYAGLMTVDATVLRRSFHEALPVLWTS